MKHLCYWLKWHLYRPQAFEAFNRLLASERSSESELYEAQDLALRRVVCNAMTRTRFYKRLYGDAGFELGDMGQIGWFQKLPIVTKNHLREFFDDFVAEGECGSLKISTTGGSTGTPTKTGYDRRVPEEIYAWRVQHWYGVKPWDHHAYVWRDTRPTKLARVKNALLWWPSRHLKLDATFMSEESIENFIRAYNRLKPTLLYGYVGAVTQLAQYVLDQSLDVHIPKMTWVTSAPLTSVQRELLIRAFKAPVCDQYGSCEVRGIAQQCPEGGGLHVNVEHVNLNFVDDTGMEVPRGEYGRTLVTNLEDYVFPLIRYENGDRGRWLKNSCCPCGRTLPMIDSVKGRVSESFRLPSGRVVNGEFLTTIFDDDTELVRSFRVIQNRNLAITVEVVPNGVDEIRRIEELVKRFSNRIGNEVPVTVRVVSVMEHDRGKIRFVVREK